MESRADCRGPGHRPPLSPRAIGPGRIRSRRPSTPSTATRRRGRHRLAADPQLYDQLLAIAPSPVVALNRAVAVAEIDGPQAALAIVDQLDLGDYYLFHAIRADLLRRAHRTGDAAQAYAAAIARAGNEKEREFLQRSLEALTG